MQNDNFDPLGDAVLAIVQAVQDCRGIVSTANDSNLNDDSKDVSQLVDENGNLEDPPELNMECGDIDKSQAARPPILKFTREKDLLNEFTENNLLLIGAFPHLFLLGEGLSSRGSVSLSMARHMLLQHAGTFAKTPHFMFAVMNQHTRHAPARSLSVHVKNKPESFAAWAEYIVNPDFEENAKLAQADPTGPEAKEILRQVFPFVRVTGRDVPYGPYEREKGITMLHAMCQMYNYPLLFYTFALDDLHNAIVLRMCFPYTDKLQPKAFLDSLQSGDLTFARQNGALDEYTIDLSFINLNKLAAENPVATSEVFKLVVEAVLEELFGLPAVHTANNKKTTHTSDRKRGIFPRALAHFTVPEIQARCAHHGHGCLWCILNSRALQEGAAYPALQKRIAAVLDTLFSANIPLQQHLFDLVKPTPTYRATYYQPDFPCVDDAFPSSEFDTHVQKCAGTHVHKHTFTCVKEKLVLKQDTQRRRAEAINRATKSKQQQQADLEAEQQVVLTDDEKDEDEEENTEWRSSAQADKQADLDAVVNEYRDGCRLAKPSASPNPSTATTAVQLHAQGSLPASPTLATTPQTHAADVFSGGNDSDDMEEIDLSAVGLPVPSHQVQSFKDG